MPIYDYRCEGGHTFDALIKVADYAEPQECPECGLLSERVILKAAAIDWKMGVSSDFPTAYDKWAKIQRSKNAKDGGQFDSANNRYGGEHE